MSTYVAWRSSVILALREASVTPDASAISAKTCGENYLSRYTNRRIGTDLVDDAQPDILLKRCGRFYLVIHFNSLTLRNFDGPSEMS